jgi:hypothetical protein
MADRTAAESRQMPGILLVLAAAVFGAWYLPYSRGPLLEVLHLPTSYSRRSEYFSANAIGWISPRVSNARYQVNEEPWRPLVRTEPRIVSPLFTAEMLARDLVPGRNTLTLQARARFRPGTKSRYVFEYDPSPVELPCTVDWAGAPLDAQDGVWQRLRGPDESRVGPRPGFEAYDRILAVTGAFAGGRRIETDVIFRESKEGREFGFGVLPMWGGHVDDLAVSPRRGWSFSLAWYWSKPGGVGCEISYKAGAEDGSFVNTYRSYELSPGVRHRIVVEAAVLRDRAGNHRGHRQRLKWWPEGAEEPRDWMELRDTEGVPLAEGPYAVALLAFYCQVEFGPVTVLPLDDVIVE